MSIVKLSHDINSFDSQRKYLSLVCSLLFALNCGTVTICMGSSLSWLPGVAIYFSPAIKMNELSVLSLLCTSGYVYRAQLQDLCNISNCGRGPE